MLSLVAFAAAYRFDSRVVLSLALSSFAAWRGLSTRSGSFFTGRPEETRWNAILCGALFLAAAAASARWKRKAHFEPVFAAFGWLLLFGGLLSGAFGGGPEWPLWDTAAGLVAAAVVVFAYRLRRPFDFAVAVVAQPKTSSWASPARSSRSSWRSRASPCSSGSCSPTAA